MVCKQLADLGVMEPVGDRVRNRWPVATTSMAGGDNNGKDSDDVSRRGFLNHAGEVAVAVGTVSVVAGGVRMIVPNVDQGRLSRMSPGTPGDFEMGTVTWLAELELFVIREQGSFGAFSSADDDKRRMYVAMD
jgi:hypothetical protein